MGPKDQLLPKYFVPSGMCASSRRTVRRRGWEWRTSFVAAGVKIVSMTRIYTSSASVSSGASWKSVAPLIENTLLKTDAAVDEIRELCDDAAYYAFAAVQVNPCWVALALELLRGSSVAVGTPVGYPTGGTLSTCKRFEAEEAIRLGASDIDMVMNVGALKSGNRAYVDAEIRSVAEIAHSAGALLKVILETNLLTIDEKIVACQLSMAAKADFVKTSTGFTTPGATIDDVALMRGVVGDQLGVKASGGIRTAREALAMIEAGASRIGTSSAVRIMLELGAPSRS